MEHFKNKSESFYREIRTIEIYHASSVSYLENFNGIFPNPESALYVFDIVPESYSRKISTKTRNGNYLTEIDLSFPLLDLSAENLAKCYYYFNKREFLVVLNSNVEKTIFGNSREKMKIEFIDNKSDDNSGNDEYTISISGQTIIKPKIIEL